jgi:hypothetical protein
MTPAEAAQYLADEMRRDYELRDIVYAAVARAGWHDLFEWAGSNPVEVVALAESWQDMVGQTPPGMERL